MTGERTLPGWGFRGFHTDGTGGWGGPLSEDLRVLSSIVQLSVTSRTVALGTPADGAIAIAPTGDANANKVAIRDNGAWVYVTAREGMMAYVQDEDIYVRWSGTAWVQSGQFYDINVFVSGKPTAAELVAKVIAVRPFAIPAALDGSYGHAEANATASTTFSLRKNGSEFGTMIWAAGQAVPALASASGATFAAGDRFTIQAPGSPDATLADIAMAVKVRLL